MTTDYEAVFEQLRRAKPDPITPLPIRAASDFFDEPRTQAAAERMPATRRPLLVAAAVMLLVGGTIGLVKRFGPGPPTELVATSTQMEFDASAPELPPARSMIRGTYQTDSLGTPLSLDLSDNWTLERNEAGLVALSDAGTATIIRPTGLADSTGLPGGDATFTRPLADLDGWLESAASSLTISEVNDPGREGLRVFDLEPNAGACPSSEACVPFITNKATSDVMVGSSEQTRIWWFEMGPFAPLAVIATGPDSTMQNADALVRSMGFVSGRAHPLAQQESWEAGLDAELPAGQIVLPALGGIEFNLPSPVSMRQSSNTVVIQLGPSTQLEILVADRAADGTPVTSVDEAIAAISEMAEVTEAGPLDAALGEMQVFDIANGPTTSSIFTLMVPTLGPSSNPTNSTAGWVVPRTGRLWITEVDDGVLLMSAGVLKDSALESLGVGEAIARTIRLGSS